MARVDSGVSGVLCIDKPLGWTSRDVVNKVGWLLGTKSAGHAGTLDPQASGVLLVAMGEATKLVRFLQDAHKTYETDIVFGAATLSDDADSPVVRTAPLPSELSAARIQAILDSWAGELEQLPPQVSALQSEGVRDYDRVRRGETVVRPPRKVWLGASEVLECHADRCKVRLTCGAGFYVRALARDLGEALDSAAHVLTLRRVSAGGFGLEQAHTIEEVQGLPQDQRAALLMPPKDAALRLLTELPIDTETTLLLRQGKRPEWTGDFSVALATCDGEPIALVELEHSEEGSRLKVVRGFASPPMVGRVAREVACDIPTGDDQAEPADRG
jgi:tRNA pseudouridine55 synthase